MSSSISLVPPPRDYVVIEIPDKVRGNTKVFANALTPRKQGKGKTSKPRPAETIWCYVFTTTVNETTYFKIGQTYLASTYGSKNRFCPMLQYNGRFQILRYGHLHETVLHQYLHDSFKSTEWYVQCHDQIAALEKALRANKSFAKELAKPMGNIEPFEAGYTGVHKAGVDEHLSLYRLRYKGKLYRLTEANIEQSLTVITAADNEVRE